MNIYKEWQHNGYNLPPSDSVDFNTTWGFEYLYVQPLSFIPESFPLTFKAFGTIHGKKGLGTVMEYYTQENIELDIGKMVTGRPGQYALFTGYRYWYNKFGAGHNLVPFAVESTWLTGARVNF
jgi:hypothetical protein